MTAAVAIPSKPLGGKAYGSIPHLPGSRRGPADKGLSEGQARICLEHVRDRHDVIIVQEKLDGSNVAAAKVNGQVLALTRAGYVATTSTFEQHHLWAYWVRENYARFDALLQEGERLCGEWLAQAHGTQYALWHEPFVAFDLIREGKRAPFETFHARVSGLFVTPHIVHSGGPCRIDQAMAALTRSGHGAIDGVEGAVWRVERRGAVDFLAKYVRPDKVDGCYLPEVTGRPPVWNWRPSK